MKVRVAVRILVLFAVLHIPRISLCQDSLEKGITELTQQIANKVSQQHKTTIAVIEFSDLRGNVTDFGRFLAEELITRLYSTEKFKVIERQLLNRVISEQKLNLSGMVDPKSAKELGKLLGVDAIVSGTITDLIKTLRVNARLISTQTGEIFAVASAEFAKDESVSKLTGSASPEVASGPSKDSQHEKSRISSESNALQFKGSGLLLSIESASHIGNVVTIVMLLQNLEDDNYRTWLWDWGGLTYLLDENGDRWNLQGESAGVKTGVELIPGTKLRSTFTFEAQGGRTGKRFTLISKFDRSTKTRDGGNAIDVVVKNIPTE